MLCRIRIRPPVINPAPPSFSCKNISSNGEQRSGLPRVLQQRRTPGDASPQRSVYGYCPHPWLWDFRQGGEGEAWASSPPPPPPPPPSSAFLLSYSVMSFLQEAFHLLIDNYKGASKTFTLNVDSDPSVMSLVQCDVLRGGGSGG